MIKSIAFYPGCSYLLKFTERAKYLISKSKIPHLDGLKPEENLKAAEFAMKFLDEHDIDIKNFKI